MSAMRRIERYRRHGWPASYPVAQFPNAPLWIAMGMWGVSQLTDGAAHDYARAGFYSALSAWAWLEISDGSNLVRRAVGAGGLAFVVVKIGEALGT